MGGTEQTSDAERTIPLTAPATGETIGEVAVTSAAELNSAVSVAEEAQKAWGAQTIKDRAQVLFAAKRIFEEKTGQIAEIISRENGKTLAEAGASVSRGIECIEFRHQFAANCCRRGPGGESRHRMQDGTFSAGSGREHHAVQFSRHGAALDGADGDRYGKRRHHQTI